MRCRRAFDIDLVAFVHDARGRHWTDFREHYPLCADCSVEVRTWTELEIVLQGGAPPATTHPTPGDLLRLSGGAPALDSDYRRIVEYHVASCHPCADEIATLRAFDFTELQPAPGCGEQASDAARPYEDGVRSSPTDVVFRGGPESGAVPAAEHDSELGAGAAGAAEDSGDAADGAELPTKAAPSAGVLTGPASSMAALRHDTDDCEAAAAGASVRRLARVARHPAMVVSLVVGLLLPVLWMARLPDFPFGVAVGDPLRVDVPPSALGEIELPDGRVALATVDESIDEVDLGGAAAEAGRIEEENIDTGGRVSAVIEESMPQEPAASSVVESPVAQRPMQAALLRGDVDELVHPPAPIVPEGSEGPAAVQVDAADPWALTRLDRAGPVEVVAARLAAGLQLEVPVPLSVLAGSVLQVEIRGDDAREIVERLSFPGAREVSIRVSAAWLVPGDYEVRLGVVRRGPAPIRVASYALVVH